MFIDRDSHGMELALPRTSPARPLLAPVNVDESVHELIIAGWGEIDERHAAGAQTAVTSSVNARSTDPRPSSLGSARPSRQHSWP
jgi:hypothetical protein